MAAKLSKLTVVGAFAALFPITERVMAKHFAATQKACAIVAVLYASSSLRNWNLSSAEEKLLSSTVASSS